MSKNDITGDEIKTKSSTDQYRYNWDRIFGKKSTGSALQDQEHRLHNKGPNSTPLIKNNE